MYRKFKHLNIPDGWEQYWSKYPNGYTIMEALIDWVSQVDDMVTNQNELTDTVKSFGERIDEFINQFGAELQKEVQDLLTEWQASGQLDVVISEALQWQLDDYIATNEQDKLSLTAQLQQKDEYEVDLLNYKDLFTVTSPEEIPDITQALKKAINDVAPYDFGLNWSAQSKSIKIPAQKFIISETIKYKSGLSIVGSGLGTEIISKVPAGEGTFDVAGTANWEMKNIMLHGDGTNHGIITTRDYTTEVNMLRYKITNVYTRYFDIGLDLQGFIGVLDKVRSNHNKIGLILEQASAVGVSACAFEQNTDTGVILKSGTSVHFNNGTVMEGNGLYELDVQGGKHVTFDTVYFENAANNDVLNTVLVGVNGDNRVFNINFDNCFFGGGSALNGAGIIDKVTNITFKNVVSHNLFRGFKVTKNAINVNYDNSYVFKTQLAEHGTSIQPKNPKNLLPNHDFAEWEVPHTPSEWLRRYPPENGANEVVITQETSLKRLGANSMRLTHSYGSGFASTVFYIPEHLIPILKNKKVTVGAWIYIPNNEHYGDYIDIKPGPGIGLTGDGVEALTEDRITTEGGNNTYQKGQWNFFQNTYSLGENIKFNNLGISLRLSTGSAINATGKYVLVDSVYLVEGLYTAGDLAQNVIS